MRQLLKELWNMPNSVKAMGIACVFLFLLCVIGIVGIPAFILLTAFPQLWILIGAFVVVCIPGYIRGKRIKR